MSPDAVQVVRVFPAGPGGGNPAPVVLAADGWSDEVMQEVAQGYGHESGFVLAGTGGTDFDLRFWVPNHEMEMCGHAAVAAVWLLNEAGLLNKTELLLGTKSGPVRALVDEIVEISQPPGRVELVAEEAEILGVLRIKPAHLADRPIVNAATSSAGASSSEEWPADEVGLVPTGKRYRPHAVALHWGGGRCI